MEQWRGKVAVVTGASAGIGAAVVAELARCGVHVVAVARRENKLKELADLLRGENYGTVYTKVCDVTKEQSVKDVFSWVDVTLGGPSILVNNAGVAKVTSLVDGKLEDWQETFNLNVLAISVCSREAYRSMTKNKINGHIFQINSIAGHCVVPRFALKMYNASKHAVTVLCDGLRQELQSTGSKIKISSVSPGRVNTDMMASVGRQIGDSYTKVDCQTLDVKDVVNAVITALATPPNVLIAETIIIPTGTTIQIRM